MTKIIMTLVLFFSMQAFAFDKNVETMLEQFQNKIDGKIDNSVVATDEKICPKGFFLDTANADGYWASICKNKSTDTSYILRTKASSIKVVGYGLSIGPNSKAKYKCDDENLAKQFMETVDSNNTEKGFLGTDYKYNGKFKGMKAFLFCGTNKNGEFKMLAAEYSIKK